MQNVAERTAESQNLVTMLGEFEDAARLTADRKGTLSMVATARRFLWSQHITYPHQVTVSALERDFADQHKHGLSPKTLLNHRSALNSFCMFLVRREVLSKNPCSLVRLRKPEEKLPRYLTEAELTETLRLAEGLGMWPEVCLAVSTGLRLSELIRLQWDDVDFDRRCLTVQKSKSHRPRVVPLAGPAVEALKRQLRKAEGFQWVFPARQTWPAGFRYVDRPRAANWWRRAFKPIQRTVPKFREVPGSSTGRAWHLLRHTFASRLAQKGVSLYKIGRWMGHSDVRTTEIYSHLQAGFDPEIDA